MMAMSWKKKEKSDFSEKLHEAQKEWELSRDKVKEKFDEVMKEFITDFNKKRGPDV